ncbi:hypothetical protein [Tenacibaculum sp. 190524A05c]|uniref:AbiTii domain-containing protein n=1 Tax=Tenacibaculum platacis TaxID=3137852 RepID=UPI0031FA507D
MIKQLIKDLAFDNISLSQGLTRTKLVENKIKNQILKNWLKKELEGYEFEDNFLPPYRKIWSTISLTVELPWGTVQKIPVSTPDSFGEKARDTMNHHRIVEPISIVEQQIKNVEGAKGYIYLPTPMVEMLVSLYQEQIDQYNGVVRNASREVGKVQYQNVLEQTKQKLLDILMELDEQFPNLLDEYKMSEENSEKVQNIITTNIYGNNNPTNIASGVNVKQTNTISISTEDEKKLTDLGVENQDIAELKEIITDKDKTSLGSKVTGWLGKVSASVAAKGLYENIPEIAEFAQNLIM